MAKPSVVTPRPRLDSLFEEPQGETFTRNGVTLYLGDASRLYHEWPSPVVIVSDGAYGLGLFPGDPPTPEGLVSWYRPHVEAWSERATAETTLWFWNTELGWATVHPLLSECGWRYVRCHVWDKGITHVAGNSNTERLRQFPCVTEVCVQYVKEPLVDGLTLKDWLRREWVRTGLPFSLTNKACGVRNAATRKYFTKDHLWYFPPPEMFERIVAFANTRGKASGRPYFSFDGQGVPTAAEWARMRAKFHCKLGITNVWREPPVDGAERLKDGTKSLHLNQKPLKLMDVLIQASSDEGDVVWEPFGGLCTAALAAHKLHRRCMAAEVDEEFYRLAVRRLHCA